MTNLKKHSLGFFPTPVHELKRLSDKLQGPRIFIKRDDQSGLSLGGNKTRKLEFLLADAIDSGCDTLVTGGAEQSNHCRQTAAAAAAAGLECHLVLGGDEPEKMTGNLLLDKLLGANVHWCGELRKGELIPEIAEKLRSEDKKPYIIPYGGSNYLGAAAFVEAYGELRGQLAEPVSQIVFASSSGGTQAGLALGKKSFKDSTAIIGIGIDKGEAGEKPFAEHVLNLANETAERLVIDGLTSIDVLLRDDFLGEGYGIVGNAEREAIRITATLEGVLLDPVYTAKAMAGLFAMIRNKEFKEDDSVLFWHTGGSPALFSNIDEIF